MNTPPVCDSVAPPLRPGERIGAVMPADVRAIQDTAIAVGTLVEATTGRPLGGASVLITRDTAFASLANPVAWAYTDRDAGFVIASPAGTYMLIARLIGRQPVRRQITLRAGVVDTVRLEMRYMSCVGY